MAGLTEAKIKKLCDVEHAKGFKAPPYWTAEVYGFGKWIREYSHYPSYLPLCVSTDHSPPTREILLKTELKSNAPYQFYHSPLLAKKWTKVTGKQGLILFSPFVFCRRKKGIVKSPKAKGTLSFPAHTTVNIEDESDMEIYIKQLLNLPQKFQPISVCLYYDDIKKGKHKIFQKYNIPIYTAGYYFDERFTERFYDVLKNFKYATSNIPGSYLYYAVEMGIPFSLYGQKHKFVNKSDPNFPVGSHNLYEKSPFCRRIYEMFNGLQTGISPEQKEFVEIYLGLREGLDPDEMRNILYQSLFKWLFSFRLFEWIFKIFRVLLSPLNFYRKDKKGV